MPDLANIKDIEDEDLLHKMLGETEQFDDRRLIRGRLREIRESRTAALANKKNDKMSEAEEAVFRSTKTETGPGGDKTTTTTTTTKHTTKDGSTQVVKQTKQVTQVGRPGGTNVTITKTSAARSTGGRGAMGGLDMGGAGRPKSMTLSPTSPSGPGGGGRVAIQRSPSAVKEMLLQWCARMTAEYDNVNITNFSSSWNDGMAFAALIHHFYPRAFDYSRLNPKCRRGNFKLAFEVAEKLGDVAPLLDVEDMVRMKNPDWKCVFTYVQSLYRRFRDFEANAQNKEGGEKKED